MGSAESVADKSGDRAHAGGAAEVGGGPACQPMVHPSAQPAPAASATHRRGAGGRGPSMVLRVLWSLPHQPAVLQLPPLQGSEIPEGAAGHPEDLQAQAVGEAHGEQDGGGRGEGGQEGRDAERVPARHSPEEVPPGGGPEARGGDVGDAQEDHRQGARGRGCIPEGRPDQGGQGREDEGHAEGARARQHGRGPRDQ
eukprot:9163416-Alexandrium_andersonii.AAC.1